MKHFIVETTYVAPMETVAAATPAHRAYLQTGYDGGLMLASGPQEPRVGGILVMRAAAREEIDRFLAQDPFNLQGLATYRVIEFNPVKFQPFLQEWLGA
jgi:uncharacterized protein YciI